MLRRISVVAVGLLCAGCPNSAGDCHNTLSCAPPEVDVVYVVSDAGTECEGICVPGAEHDWQQPTLVWLGYQDTDPPECPLQAPSKRDYHAATAAPACGTCSCSPPSGSCTLPAAASAHDAACPAELGIVETPFDPPSGWDGSCTAHQAIAANLDCDGKPCVQSVTFAPLAVSEVGCVPKTEPAKPAYIPKNAKKGLTLARACTGTPFGHCADNGHACVPVRPRETKDASGFWAHCVSHAGAGDAYTMTCPVDYPLKYVFSIDFEDTRGCAPCACAPPAGSTCTSLVSVYADDDCSPTAELGSITVSSAPMCLNLPPGARLGSKRATPPLYEPGSCKPRGGEPIGGVENIGPFTFCCQPQPDE